jgi:DNA primase
VIGEYVELIPSGKVLMGRCCFHEDRIPSLAVFPETQTFHCFGCGKGGDVITFLMELEGFSFREALWVLNQHTHAA